MSTAVLTRGQVQALAVRLRHIEEELARVEEMLEWTYRGVLISFVDDLSPSARQGVRERIQRCRELVGGVAQDLRLPSREMRKSRWISGTLVQLWVAAEECRSPALRGYGPVSDGLPAVVDPVAGALGDLLIAMDRIVRRGAGQ